MPYIPSTITEQINDNDVQQAITDILSDLNK